MGKFHFGKFKTFRKAKPKIRPSDKLDSASFLLDDDQDESRLVDKALGDWHSFKVLLSYAKGYYVSIFTSLVFIFLSSALALYSSKYFGDLVELGLMKKNLSNCLRFSIYILLLEFLSVFFVWSGRSILSKSSSYVIFNIRKKLFSKLNELPLSYYDRQPQGRIVTRITHDVEGIDDFFTSSLGNLLSAFVMTVLAIFAMLFSHFKLGLIMTLSMIPSIFLMVLTKDLMRDSNRRVSKYSSAINAKLSEFLSGFEVIRSLGLEQWSKRKFDKNVDDYLSAQLRGNFLFSWSIPLVSFFATLPLIGLVWFGGKGVLEGTFSVGLFFAFVRYYERFFNPLMLLSREIHVVQQAFTSIERVMGFVSEKDESEVLVSTGNLSFSSLDGDLKFENVSMFYDDTSWVLKGISFHIKPGEKIGFVGRTGCGKSTTVSLLTRLYEYQKGDILVDNISIRNFNRHSLRDQIGFVSQDSIIFRGTLRDNLSCVENCDDQKLYDASKTTGLVQALSREGFNLDLEILDGGLNLSVGQRQLISLTRVLIKNPSILILDEATANIDPYYEALIHQAVMKMMENRTCLIIAHRLDTLKQCDRIFVFNDGVLVEQGSLDVLLSNKSYFYNLHHAQFMH